MYFPVNSVNILRSSCKAPCIFVQFLPNLHIHDRFLYKSSIVNFTDIYPVGAELIHADRQTDGQTFKS
jgi:hypothetical protein